MDYVYGIVYGLRLWRRPLTHGVGSMVYGSQWSMAHMSSLSMEINPLPSSPLTSFVLLTAVQ